MTRAETEAEIVRRIEWLRMAASFNDDNAAWAQARADRFRHKAANARSQAVALERELTEPAPHD